MVVYKANVILVLFACSLLLISLKKTLFWNFCKKKTLWKSQTWSCPLLLISSETFIFWKFSKKIHYGKVWLEVICPKVPKCNFKKKMIGCTCECFAWQSMIRVVASRGSLLSLTSSKIRRTSLSWQGRLQLYILKGSWFLNRGTSSLTE